MDTLTTFIGWQVTEYNHYYYKTLYVENFSHWGQTFDHLNIISDDRDLNADGFAYLYAYSGEYGLVRWSYHGEIFNTTGHGWDLLPE